MQEAKKLKDSLKKDSNILKKLNKEYEKKRLKAAKNVIIIFAPQPKREEGFFDRVPMKVYIVVLLLSLLLLHLMHTN